MKGNIVPNEFVKFKDSLYIFKLILIYSCKWGHMALISTFDFVFVHICLFFIYLGNFCFHLHLVTWFSIFSIVWHFHVFFTCFGCSFSLLRFTGLQYSARFSSALCFWTNHYWDASLETMRDYVQVPQQHC